MKPIILALCFLAAANAAFIPSNPRYTRDVSEIIAEPAYSYLPPESKLNIPAAELEPATELEEVEPEQLVEEIEVVTDAAVPAESAVLGENGYEYKTVRRLRYRQRRDVSHLNLEYLPPIAPQPSKQYLPPVKHSLPVPLLKISNEYLPPLVKEAIIVEEPIPEPEPEITEAPAPVETEAPEIVTEAVTEPATTTTTTEAPLVESAVLKDDGYHYKQPDVVPDLAPVPEALTREYLPPLEEGVVVAEGPGEETAILADDGYHYRAIKRLRF